MGIHHVVADLYHEHIYRHIAARTAKLADMTDKPITDIAAPALLFGTEIITGLLGYMVYKQTQPDLAEDPSQFLISLGVTMGIAGVVYFGNEFRTPLEQKLDLELPDELDKEMELAYTIGKLNELEDSPPLSFDEVNERANEAVDAFTTKTEGYNVHHATKTKKSRFSKHLVRRGILGLMNPLFQEVMVFSEKKPGVIAHEKAHLVGYARENEAQFVGYASMLESEDPSMQYLAYGERLDMVRRVFFSPADNFIDDLEERGLNQRTLSELRDFKIFLDGELAQNSRYRKGVKWFGRKCRSGTLRLLGQGNLQNTYGKKPLQMITAYDPPTL